MSRRRPLHTCGASVLAIIHTACSKAQELNGPLGKWVKRITKLTSIALPLMYLSQCLWLTILSFTDDRILTFERLVETIFPPSTLLFDKIDDLVYTAEAMPGRFDEALNRFIVTMQRVPFLDWALMQIIRWLDGSYMEEKDIMIDMNSNVGSNVTESAQNTNCPSQELPSAYCHPEEKIVEVGKPASNDELPAFAKSKNNEKLVSVSGSTENDKYTVDSSTGNQSGNLISAPLVDPSQESVDRQAEFPSTADSPGDFSQEKWILVDHAQLPNTAKEGEHPHNKIFKGDTSQDKTKSIGAKLGLGIVKGTKKGTFGKQTNADNSREKLQQNRVREEKVGKDKEEGTEKRIKENDPVLELFESRWHL